VGVLVIYPYGLKSSIRSQLLPTFRVLERKEIGQEVWEF